MYTAQFVISLLLVGGAMLAQAQASRFVISPVAGVPQVPPTPAKALSVSIGSPTALAADTAGNVYFTTSFAAGGENYEVLFKLDQSGILTRIAGYTAGFSGDGGPAAAARIDSTAGVAVDSSGNIYITDSGRVRRIATDGTIATIATTAACCALSSSSGKGGPAVNAAFTFSFPEYIAVDAGGNLYVGDPGTIRKISTNGIVTTIAGNGI